MSGYLFEESQKFNQWYLWLIMGTSSLVFVGIIINALTQQLYYGESWGDTPLSDGALITIMLLMVVALVLGIWLFYRFQLDTRVDRRGLHYRLLPFFTHWRFIPKSEINSYTVAPYRFRGIGILPSFLGTLTYNIRGKYGLRLQYNNKEILIGTQKPEALEEAIQLMMSPTE